MLGFPLGILSAAGAGGAAGDYELIESSILEAASTSSVTFSSLGTYASTYKHLQVRFTAQTVGTSTTATAVNVRLNGDTAANYTYHVMQGQGSSVASTNQVGVTSMVLQNSLPRTSETNKFGAGVIDFLDAFSSTKNTTLRSLHGSDPSGEKSIGLSSGLWLNTASITSIDISFDFGAGTRVSLYGLKG